MLSLIYATKIVFSLLENEEPREKRIFFVHVLYVLRKKLLDCYSGEFMFMESQIV